LIIVKNNFGGVLTIMLKIFQIKIRVVGLFGIKQKEELVLIPPMKNNTEATLNYVGVELNINAK